MHMKNNIYRFIGRLYITYYSYVDENNYALLQGYLCKSPRHTLSGLDLASSIQTLTECFWSWIKILGMKNAYIYIYIMHVDFLHRPFSSFSFVILFPSPFLSLVALQFLAYWCHFVLYFFNLFLSYQLFYCAFIFNKL